MANKTLFHERNILIPLAFLFLALLTANLCLLQGVQAAPVALPVPSGHYSIGTSELHLTDISRKDPFASGSRQFRELMVQIWYPARKVERSTTLPYLNPALLEAMKSEKYFDLDSGIINSWENIRTHSVLDAPFITRPRKLPLLIFSPGHGLSRSTYTSIFENLASRGYIVAAIDHPYGGLTVLPDGRVLSSGTDARGPEAVVERVETMARDASFVLDVFLNKRGAGRRFTNYIDAKRVGMLGHSLGGAASLEICRSDARFIACADLDGDAWGKVEKEGIARPFLVMLNEPNESHRPPAAIRKERDDTWAAIVSKRNTTASVVKIGGTFHLSFTDLPFIVPDDLLKRNGADIEPQRGLEIITNVLNEFFSQHFNGKNKSSFKTVTASYKEVTAKTFNY